MITLSAADPPPDYYLVDKLLTVCFLNQIEPLLCLTKTDLSEDWQSITAGYREVGCRIIETAPDDEESLAQLSQWITGRVVSFAGQSGVGKSTLLNRLGGDTLMPTGLLSTRVGRGRHTTRHVELFPLADGYLADTPGFSSLELYELGIDGDSWSPAIRKLPESPTIAASPAAAISATWAAPCRTAASTPIGCSAIGFFANSWTASIPMPETSRVRDTRNACRNSMTLDKRRVMT